ncbi:hypothetical protein X751_08670 [Mesorhizobium sp. LNJC395A00]|nr:hypothetical protein X751_08670 [Mesorhizobium sp. LNJC395A00]
MQISVEIVVAQHFMSLASLLAQALLIAHDRSGGVAQYRPLLHARLNVRCRAEAKCA